MASADPQPTNFDKVRDFNITADVSKVDSPASADVFDSHPDMIKTCLSLIMEEVQELNDAVKAKDIIETRDALADILYVVYGMAFRMGINANKDFDLVHENNMTKFCKSEAEAQETVEKYKQLYKENKSPYPTPGFKFVKETGLWVVYEQSTGKILKNINYTRVDLA